MQAPGQLPSSRRPAARAASWLGACGAVQKDEAPACMRCRGLACRAAGAPIARRLVPARSPAGSDTLLKCRFPGLPAVPESPPGASVFGSDEVLLPDRCPPQGLCRSFFKILSLSTGHARLSPGHLCFPPGRPPHGAQCRPAAMGAGRQRSRSLSALAADAEDPQKNGRHYDGHDRQCRTDERIRQRRPERSAARRGRPAAGRRPAARGHRGRRDGEHARRRRGRGYPARLGAREVGRRVGQLGFSRHRFSQQLRAKRVGGQFLPVRVKGAVKVANPPRHAQTVIRADQQFRIG